jgi:hypothetical protein
MKATFGKTTDGPNGVSYATDCVTGITAAPDKDGAAVSITARMKMNLSSPTVARAAIYLPGATGALLAFSDELAITNFTEQAITFPLTGANRIRLTAGQQYKLAIFLKASVSVQPSISAQTGVGGFVAHNAAYGPTPPDPFGSTSFGAGTTLDIFCSYVPDDSFAPVVRDSDDAFVEVSRPPDDDWTPVSRP